jgi:4'-phosphopantetheinyl transferase
MRAPALSPGSEAQPDLAAGEVHLWWIGREMSVGAAAAARSTVSASEQARASRMRNVIAREHFLLQHHALREILGAYVGLPPQALAFEFNPFGKPALAARQGGNGLSFNLSRSGAAAVLAVTRHGRIGVDLERLRPVPEIDAIARRMFSPAEAKALAGTPPGERCASFLGLWAGKEAVVKALGGGLSIALDAFDIDHPADARPTISRWALDAHPLGSLRLMPVPPIPDYVIALAADTPAQGCRLLHWPGDPDWPKRPSGLAR